MKAKLFDPTITGVRQNIPVLVVPEAVNCQDLLDEVATRFRSLAEAKGLRFEVIVPTTKITIQTDRQALSQILLNLTDNAIKFTNTGSVCIELRRRIGGERRKTSTEFNIEDTGVGLRPDEQVQVFHAFGYLNRSNLERYKTRGLGLYLSQQLVGLLGGHIEMMSVHGRGSIFRLVLLEQ